MSTQQHPENGRPAGRPTFRLCDRHLLTPTCQLGPTRTAAVLWINML